MSSSSIAGTSSVPESNAGPGPDSGVATRSGSVNPSVSRETEEALDYSYMQRVKVYKLNAGGTWDDKGTGHVSIEHMRQSDAAGLVVISEEDTSTLLIHRISREEIYQRQGADTIISWLDPDLNTDIAISFQEAIGCNYIWEQIQSVHDQYASAKGEVQRTGSLGGAQHGSGPTVGGSATGPGSDNTAYGGSNTAGTASGSAARRVVDEFDAQGASGGGPCTSTTVGEKADDDMFADGGASVEFPEPAVGNLAEVARMVNECTSPYAHEKVAQALLRKGYLRKLLDVFRTTEDIEDADGLANAFKAVKGIVLLNDTNVFDLLLSEEVVMDVVGALEYDPELPTKQEHRAFLRERVVFKEVVPISDPTVRAKIHQTYRIGYLKDVILARVLDDATFNTLSSLMLFNNVEVALALQSDPAFFRELFARLRAHDPTTPEWADLIAFLQELCSIAKYLQPVHRAQLFNTLVTNGLFNVLTAAVGGSLTVTKLKALDILLSSLHQDPSTLRNFLNQQAKHELFSLLVEGLVATDQDGVQEQILEILRLLLDPESVEQSVNTFLETFYDKYVDKLIGALATCLGTSKAVEDTSTPKQPQTSASTLNLIVELLCFCVKYHSYRIKYYVLRNNVVEKVLKLTQRPERFLVVAAVRFLRTCIGLKDEFYHRYLTKNNLFEPVINVFVSNGESYNLLNSAVIEMVDFIRRENLKSLISHLMENFGAQLEGITYVDTFQQLKIRWEQQQDGHTMQLPQAAASDASGSMQPLNPGSSFRNMEPGSGARRQRRDARTLDKDEEDYFSTGSDDTSEDDDDDLATNAAAGAGRAGRGGSPTGGPGSVSAAARAAAPASPSSGPLRAAMLVDYDDDAPIIGPPPPGQSSGDEEARASGSRGGAGDGASPTNLTIEVDASQTRSNSSDNTKDTCIKNGIGAKREVGSSDADDGDKSGAGSADMNATAKRVRRDEDSSEGGSGPAASGFS